MTKAKIAVFGIFLGFVVAAIAVEVRWTQHLMADDVHSDWRYRMVTAAILMIGVQALLEWLDSRPYHGGPRKPGFPVMPRRKD